MHPDPRYGPDKCGCILTQAMDIIQDVDQTTVWVMQLQAKLSEGTGDFDQERMLQKLPKQLGLSEWQVKTAVEGLAASRKQNVLVQGIAHLRSRKLPEVIKDLNNLLACNKVSM